MIPKFPEFKNLELSDKEEIENITKQFPPHSDFHFVSIFCWDGDNSTLISTLYGNLILKQIDCLSGEKYFSFIGINSVPETVKEISAFLHSNKLPLVLRWVPEETVKCLNGIKATITEDRDYFDYICNVSDFYHATGGKYKSYRKAISNFNRKYPYITSRQIDITNCDVKIQINALFKTWSENKEREGKEDVHFEYLALNKLLSLADEFKTLVTLGVFNKEEMIGFTIEDIYGEEYGCGLFWKANVNYSGVYSFLQKEVINLYNNKGIKFMNIESDIGIESLRTSKMRYHPEFFLKKYMIEIDVPVTL